MNTLETERLILRRWQAKDMPVLTALCNDPKVMEFFPALLTEKEVKEMIERIERHFDEKAFGLWAAELKSIQKCIGFIGLWTPPFEAPFTPCVEIGWRLEHAHWGQGLAAEGARRVLEFAKKDLKLKEVVALATRGNLRSHRVMQKLGMSYDPTSDFDHPKIPLGHPLRAHVLYRISL